MKSMFGIVKDVYFSAKRAKSGECIEFVWFTVKEGAVEHEETGRRAQVFWDKAQGKYKEISDVQYSDVLLQTRANGVAGSLVAAQIKEGKAAMESLPAKNDNEKEFGIAELKAEFEELRSGAAGYYNQEIDEKESDTAIIFSKKIAKVGRTAKKLMDAATAPINMELARVTAVFKPLVDECRDWSRRIKQNAETAILLKEQREKERLREEKERLAAEQLKIAEQAAKLDPDKADVIELVNLSQQLAQTEKDEKKLQADIKGASAAGVTGLKATLREYPKASIVDAAVFLKFLAEKAPEENEKVMAAMEASALRLFKSGIEPAGAVKTMIKKLV